MDDETIEFVAKLFDNLPTRDDLAAFESHIVQHMAKLISEFNAELLTSMNE